MAKRRKEKDEEEEQDFKMPKFDEEKFLKRERRNIKTTLLSFLLGVIIAVISFGFWALLKGNDFRWELVLLFGLFSAAWIKYLFIRLKIDLTDFGRKGWLGSYAVYFLSWLLVFIIIVNPPFYDDEPPRVELVTLPSMQEPGGNVKIVAKITDNADVEIDDIALNITYPDGNTTNLSPSDYDYDGTIITFIFNNTENTLGEFSFILTAEDVNGQTTTKNGAFTYDEDVIEITSSYFKNLTSGDDITIEVDEDVSSESFRVYYRLNNGEEINVNRKYVEIKEEYETSPEYEGWEEQTEYTMSIYAEVSHYFTNVNRSYKNTVEDITKYNFSTYTSSGIGSDTPPMPWNWTKTPGNQAEVILNYDYADTNKNGVIEPDELNNRELLPHPHYVNVPGFEAIIFLISLIAVVLILKYRKKDRRN